MGQYPSPYMPPQFPMGPGNPAPLPDPLTPARRASTMMFVLGLLGLLAGGCIGLVVLVVTPQQFEILRDQAQKSAGDVAISAQMLRMLYTVMAIAGLAFGAIVVFLAIFVRRASKVAIVFATIILGLLLIWMALNELRSLVVGMSNPVALLGSCMMLVPIILIGLTTRWLVQMLKALPHLEAARQQWQAYYAAMQQQQQAYAQQAYAYPPQMGYGQPPSGAPPVVMPPAIGYGAMPPVVPPPAPSVPPVQQPPEEQNLQG